MSFFYDLNKRLDSIRATPEVTHQQLNERDLGKHNNATTGFAALAKKTNPKIAGSQLKHMREKGQVEEGSPYKDYTPIDEPVAAPKSTASAPKPPPKPKPPKAIDDEMTNEAAKYRDPKYQDILYTQEPPDYTDTREYDNARWNPKPDDYAGRKRKIGGGEFSHNDPLRKGFGRSGTGSPVEKGPRKGLPKRDQITSLKGSIKDAHGTHTRPNLPEAGDTPAGLAAVKKVGQRADRAIQDAGTGRSDSQLANPGKAYDARDRAGAIQKRERDKQNAQNPTRVVGGPNHGNQMEEGGGIPMTAKQKSFAALAPPANKITFADRIAGAKKEVDEMLGQVAADAMKNALGGGRGRNAEMDESHFDDTPTRRRSSSGGEIDTSEPGVTRHRPVKGNYSGAAHSGEERRAARQADAADRAPGTKAGRRTVGAGKGTKIGAKINTGNSKLVNKPAIGASGKPKPMTKENDQDPADQGEYDQEGAMGRNEIHTMMRNAKQLEQMLGDNDNLPEWVQKKLSLASDYMQTIADYLASEKETDAEDQSGEEMELAEKKSARSKPKQSSGNDGNLANNAKPYDKVTRGDVVAGRLGKDEMGGKKKSTKPSAKKEEEVDESTTAGSVATAPTASKASKGGMSFGKGIYDSIDRAVERQINESMNISMNMSNEGGGAGQTLTITATDEDATQLAQMLKMAGLGGSNDMSHGEDDLADQIRQAEQGHGGAAFGGEEVCAGCGMTNCGCDEMVDETYGDNVVDMNSPNYPTNTESAQDNFGYSGGLNKPKHDVAGNGQSTVPVTAVRGQDDDFQESIQRMREIAGIKETPSMFFPDPRDTANQLGIKAQSRLIDTPTPMSTSSNRSYNNTFLDPAQKAQNRLARQNESIFTDTANLWKSYKG